MGNPPTVRNLHLVVDAEANSKRERIAMNSVDVYYLWKTGDMARQTLAVFLEASFLAIDDRIPPKGLKDD